MGNADTNTRHAVDEAMSRTVVIVPARDEESSIGLVLKDLPAVAKVIVVDNGSTDRTALIAQDSGCVVVREPIAGYGRACLAGISRLPQLQRETTVIRYVAFVDGDYSDHPQELAEMLRVLVHDEADFVLGSRMLGQREPGAMPFQAVWGNRLACLLMRLIWNARYTDLGPFRVIRYRDLMQLEMRDQNFGWTIEMQIKAKLAGLRIVELPVPYRRRVGVSKISGTVNGTIQAGYKILYTIAYFAIQPRLLGRTAKLTDQEPVHDSA